MPTSPPQDRVAAGRERLAARARRASNLRRRVVAATLASFALAWGVIAFNGPMGMSASTTTTASTQSTPAATATPTSTDDSTTSDNSSSDNTVTTSQS